LDEAAFESSRPLYIGSHEDERRSMSRALKAA
jgi:hypothetical protein